MIEATDLGITRVGKATFGGVIRPVYLDFVPEAKVGDYVLVHVGFAIGVIDEAEALRTYEILQEMGALADEGIEVPVEAAPSP